MLALVVMPPVAAPVDAATGTTVRVSVSSAGEQGQAGSTSPNMSGDSRFIAFESLATNLVAGDTNGVWDVFVHDKLTGATERVSVGNDESQANEQSVSPEVSADGRFVAFHSIATNLVPGDTNNRADVFIRDRQTGSTERLSVAGGGAQSDGQSSGASINADGRYVAFESVATNL
ncbi:MAG: calcium-binding protein, partial [Acidimicrobiales bacterium]